MKIAILISGHCRTFVYQEQRIFFENLIKYLSQFGKCDTYLMLKTDSLMQTGQGISNLQKIIQTINPVYSIAFKQWRENDDNCYYSQMKMIRHLIDKSMINDYDYYVRIRPDCIIPNLEHIKLNHPLCTSRKFDAAGNDQFFIMSKRAVNEWFLNIPIIVVNTSPEYYIFNHVNKCINIDSGLVRSYKRIEGWNSYHCHLNVKNYWLSEQLFEPIPYDIFVNKLKNIMHYYEVI
jgi:hypothetical protein